MGSCCSSPQPQDAEARQRTQEIDRRLEDDYRRLRKEVKILLLGTPPSLLTVANGAGSGESGKSTVVKQMKILHQDGFNNTELLTNRQIIYRNLIDSAKSVVQFLKEFEILPANPEILVRSLYA
jgi:guanine nucleotide-binding protein G(i) subunit alpha